MPVCVKLTADSLVDYSDFCTAIAQALCPAGEQGFEGIDCIVGIEGLVVHRVPIQGAEGHGPGFLRGLQTALISDDGYTLDELLQYDQAAATLDDTAELHLSGLSTYQVVETLMPFVMSEHDRSVLEAVLPKLPALKYPISGEAAAAFMEAYVRLPGRPRWRPVLMTEADIERRRADQAAIRTRHQQAIQHDFHAGRLVAVDRHHVPVAALTFGTFLPREQAIAYLDRCGFEHADHGANIERGVAQPQGLDLASVKPVDRSSTVGKTKLTPEQRARLVAHYRKLQAAGKPDFAKQTAEKFDITTRHVRNIVRAADEAEREIQSVGRRVIRRG